MKNIKKTLSIIVAALMLLSTFSFLASAEECVEHNYSIITSVPPTCVEDGYIHYLCSVCGHDYKDYTGGSPALDHSFGEWQVVTPASCAAEGLMKQVCSKCGGSETRTISVLEHVDLVADGKCDDCGASVDVNTDVSPFDWLVALFNAILQWFRDLFA